MSSKENIEPIQPKKGGEVSIFGRAVTSMGLLRDLIRNPSEKGWPFNTGDPEVWKFSSRLIVPGGRALDLGSSLGRTSVPFALQDMKVTAYETNPDFVKAMEAVVENFDLPISVLNEDVRTADFGKDRYDTVILGQTFAHFESREEAFKVIDKAIGALKPGGSIWFRGNGPGYDGIDCETLSLNGNKEHYMNTCDCSGEKRMEPHLFFDPLKLIELMSKRGIKIVHTQMVPESGKANIMYGENWAMDRDYFDETVSMGDLLNGVFDDSVQRRYRADDIITIIGQKK